MLVPVQTIKEMYTRERQQRTRKAEDRSRDGRHVPFVIQTTAGITVPATVATVATVTTVTTAETMQRKVKRNFQLGGVLQCISNRFILHGNQVKPN